MDKPWQLCRTIGPLLSQRFPLASAKALPRGDFQFQVCHQRPLLNVSALLPSMGHSLVTKFLSDFQYMVPGIRCLMEWLEKATGKAT